MKSFGDMDNLSQMLFKRKIERVIWELMMKTSFEEIINALSDLLLTL